MLVGPGYLAVASVALGALGLGSLVLAWVAFFFNLFFCALVRLARSDWVGLAGVSWL